MEKPNLARVQTAWETERGEKISVALGSHTEPGEGKGKAAGLWLVGASGQVPGWRAGLTGLWQRLSFSLDVGRARLTAATNYFFRSTQSKDGHLSRGNKHIFGLNYIYVHRNKILLLRSLKTTLSLSGFHLMLTSGLWASEVEMLIFSMWWWGSRLGAPCSLTQDSCCSWGLPLPLFPGNPVFFPSAEAATNVGQHKHWLLESWGICFWHQPQKHHYFLKVIREQLHHRETSWRDSCTSPFPVSGPRLSPILSDKTDFNLWE